jgi:hypothetical protein
LTLKARFLNQVAIEGHDPSTFRLMLEWIYCDNVQMPTTAEGCLQLLALAEGTSSSLRADHLKPQTGNEVSRLIHIIAVSMEQRCCSSR